MPASRGFELNIIQIMSHKLNARHIKNEQQDSWQAIRVLSESVRLFAGLFVCALFCWTFPSLLGNLLTLGKHGVRDFNNMLVNIIVLSLLMGVNYVGHKLNKVLVFGIAFTIPLLLWRVWDTIFHTVPADWHNYIGSIWWSVNIVLGFMPLLNAVLFLKFKQLAGLKSEEKKI